MSMYTRVACALSVEIDFIAECVKLDPDKIFPDCSHIEKLKMTSGFKMGNERFTTRILGQL